LQKLNGLLQEIATKENETLKLEKQASSEGDIETQTIVSQLRSRYQGLIPATQVSLFIVLGQYGTFSILLHSDLHLIMMTF